MGANVIEKATGLVERRFVLNALLPSCLFWAALCLVVVIDRGDLAQAATAWAQQSSGLQLIEAVGFVGWSFFFAALLSASVTTIVRLFEGYWQFPFGERLAEIGRAYHKNRLCKLAKRSDADDEVYTAYPHPTRPEAVMPTRLGNILKSGEMYPVLRYGVPSVLVWPRLYHLVPQPYLQTLADARSGLDFMTTVSLLAGLFAVTSGIYLIVAGGDWWFFLLCLWGGFAVARLAYTAACSNAVLYAEQVKTAFDLYRHLLFTQIRVPLPTTLKEEREMWDQLGQWWYRNDDPPRVRFAADGTTTNSERST